MVLVPAMTVNECRLGIHYYVEETKKSSNWGGKKASLALHKVSSLVELQ